MKAQHFQIHLGVSPGASWVELDGVRLTSLTGIRIETSVRNTPRVSCDFINVTIDGDVETLEVGAEQ